MKTYKIRGVEKDVCCVEQKLAYNIAFRCHINYGDQYRECKSAVVKSEMIVRLRNEKMKELAENYDTKYNPDALFIALNQGLENYIENPFIASEYESIGKAFPIPY